MKNCKFKRIRGNTSEPYFLYDVTEWSIEELEIRMKKSKVHSKNDEGTKYKKGV